MPKFHTDVFWQQAMFISMPGDENNKDYAGSAKAETMTKQEFEKSLKGELKRQKLKNESSAKLLKKRSSAHNLSLE